MPKRWKVIKYQKLLLLLYITVSFPPFAGNDHTILVNKYQGNYDDIYVKTCYNENYQLLTTLIKILTNFICT